MSSENKTADDTPQPVEVHGFVKEGFEDVLKVFRKQLEDGVDKGGSFAAYYKGELVVNVWGGEIEKEAKWMWEEGTMNCFFSTTKSFSAIVIAHMVDRGLLDYGEKISKYWPEFGQNGKEDIILETFMSSKAGLAALDEPFEFSWVLDDTDRLGTVLAKQAPLWEPGTQFGYHPITLAMYLDEIVRRVDTKNRTLAQYFREEIAEPFEINIFIGLPLELFYKAAPIKMLIDMSPEEVMESVVDGREDLRQKILSNPKQPNGNLYWNSPKFRQLPIGSSLGHGTTEAVAKFHGILANGGVHNGKRLLSEEAIERQQVPLSRGKEIVYGMDIMYSLGTMVLAYADDDSPPRMMFGHSGYGGQMGMTDPTYKVGFAYGTNHLHPIASSADENSDSRWFNLQESLFHCVYKIQDVSVERKTFITNTLFEQYENSRK